MSLNDSTQEQVRKDEQRYKKLVGGARRRALNALWCAALVAHSVCMAMTHFIERVYLGHDFWNSVTEASLTVTVIVYPILAVALFAQQAKKARKLYRAARIVKDRIEAQKP